MNSPKILSISIIFIVSILESRAAKILVIVPHFGKSHFVIFEPYLEELANRGHELLVLSYFARKQSIPNYKDIDLMGTFIFNETVDVISLKERPTFRQITSNIRLGEWGAQACENTLKHPPVQELLKSDQKFDLLITETFNTDCFLAFAHKFKIPSIALSTCVFMPWSPDRIGNPDNPSYIPIEYSASSDRMDFVERLTNTFFYVVHKILAKYTMDAKAHKIASKYFGDNLPSMPELARNTTSDNRSKS
ncbi:hypothetical protein C0J52_02576 [Blattella germanica]|nr:hypothetical protein C0J52_02576 [Blattella germanica]